MAFPMSIVCSRELAARCTLNSVVVAHTPSPGPVTKLRGQPVNDLSQPIDRHIEVLTGVIENLGSMAISDDKGEPTAEK